LSVASLDNWLTATLYCQNSTLLLTSLTTVKPEEYKIGSCYNESISNRFNFTLKMEATDGSETLLAFYQTTVRRITQYPVQKIALFIILVFYILQYLQPCLIHPHINDHF
jgi:hypothetical protein